MRYMTAFKKKNSTNSFLFSSFYAFVCFVFTLLVEALY